MTKPRNYYERPGLLREINWAAIDLAQKIPDIENQLIVLLRNMDNRKYYLRFGRNSVRGYCEHVLGFSKTQSQRIATKVRQLE